MPGSADDEKDGLDRLYLSREDAEVWMDFLTRHSAPRNGFAERHCSFPIEELKLDKLMLYRMCRHSKPELVVEVSLEGATLEGYVEHVNTVNLLLTLADGTQVYVESTMSSYTPLRVWIPRGSLAV